MVITDRMLLPYLQTRVSVVTMPLQAESVYQLAPASNSDLLANVEQIRVSAFAQLGSENRSRLGQYGTPANIAIQLVQMVEELPVEIRLLDAGAGVGSLTAAVVSRAVREASRPKVIDVACYEIEPILVRALGDVLRECEFKCREAGIEFRHRIIQEDFILSCCRTSCEGMFAGDSKQYNLSIQNPPYKKIRSNSEHRKVLSAQGIETSNLYSAFVSLTIRQLEPKGQLVAITPRSFCNGPYFKSFRLDFFERMSLAKIHVFEERNEAFDKDSVLQENVIFSGVRSQEQSELVEISSTSGGLFGETTTRSAKYSNIVPSAKDATIHLLTSENSESIAEAIGLLPESIWSLGLEVSTGRVVEFRKKHLLKEHADKDTAALIRPANLCQMRIVWPISGSKKPIAIKDHPESQDLMLPSGWYVLVKRLTAKEEPRRIVASLLSPDDVGNKQFAVENHVNVIHLNNGGMPEEDAKGLTLFLNSTIIDEYFRLFSGHTQVNATDLRALKYPSPSQLHALANKWTKTQQVQCEVDSKVDKEIFRMAKSNKMDSVKVKKRVDETTKLLELLGFPKKQQNERSALTLLALLNLRPSQRWSSASKHLIGITQIMNFMREHYGKNYAPNSREGVRKNTVHQFMDASLVLKNPYSLDRPTNDGNTAYQIEDSALNLIQKYKSKDWNSCLADYLSSVETLRQKYSQQREMRRIPIELPDGFKLSLSPGGQNPLVAALIEEFCPRYVQGARVVYVGDTDEKHAYFDNEYLAELGVKLDAHGKIPDVIVHDTRRNWLLLIEAVTSHGLIDPKRHNELVKMFSDSNIGLVFVTSFLDRRTWLRYAAEISWETEVWIADDPTHLIHYNGKRFLGPYEADSDS